MYRTGHDLGQIIVVLRTPPHLNKQSGSDRTGRI